MKKAWIAVLILAALAVAEKGMGWNSDSPILWTGSSQERQSCEDSAMLLRYWGIAMTAEELEGRCGPAVKTDKGRYGCSAMAAAQVTQSFLQQYKVPGGLHLTVRNMTGMQLAEIYGSYILKGIPVMIWSESEENEVCRVMIGGDGDCYYFQNPDTARGVIKCLKTEVRSAYEELGKQALALIPDNKKV